MKKVSIIAFVLLMTLALSVVTVSAATLTVYSTANAAVTLTYTRNPAYGNTVLTAASGSVSGSVYGGYESFSNGSMNACIDKAYNQQSLAGITCLPGQAKSSSTVSLNNSTYYRAKVTLNANAAVGDSEGSATASIG